MWREEIIERIQAKYKVLEPVLNERSKRLWAAAEAVSYNRGGVAWVSKATGISHNTIDKGIREIQERRNNGIEQETGRIRAKGGGRKSAQEKEPDLLSKLRDLVEASTRGDPQSPLCWTNKSTYNLSCELGQQGYSISPGTIRKMLKEEGYSLQSNRKTKEGKQNPDRNEQFEYINKQSKKFMREGQPVISVDTKKKELVGNFSNKGREWREKGKPAEVSVHDFMDKELGKAIPYGVYDIKENEGWVSVGIDHDTAEFASDAILRWWQNMGIKRYRGAKKLLIMSDGGGSNASRSNLWKAALQNLANKLKIPVHVCHFPPGTSKWNKIEHRMFSHITQNWRGKPLVSHEVIVNLIANTTTAKGLRIEAELNTDLYQTGKKVENEILSKLQLRKKQFHGDWNYSILPQ
jgi:transposase